MPESSSVLEGKVASLVSARELAINIGSEQGVKSGMLFAVLAPTPLDVRDPQTGELLGHVDREKVRVRASEVNPKFTICRTFRKVRRGGGPFAAGNRSTSEIDDGIKCHAFDQRNGSFCRIPHHLSGPRLPAQDHHLPSTT